MEEDTRQTIRDLAYYSSLGFSVALAIFIGLFLGVFIDSKFGTGPTGMFVGLGIGIVAGFRNILHAVKKVQRMDNKERDE